MCPDFRGILYCGFEIEKLSLLPDDHENVKLPTVMKCFCFNIQYANIWYRNISISIIENS